MNTSPQIPAHRRPTPLREATARTEYVGRHRPQPYTVEKLNAALALAGTR